MRGEEMSFLLIRWEEDVIASLPISEEIIIGRDPSCQFFLPDPKVSRRHARIYKAEDNKYVLCDLNSWNGTYLNGRKISKAELKEGDFIQIGDTTLEFTKKSRAKSVITEVLAKKRVFEHPRSSEFGVFIAAAGSLKKAQNLESWAGALIDSVELALSGTSAWVTLFGSSKKRITYKREGGNLMKLFTDPLILDDYIKKLTESGQALSLVKGDMKENLSIAIAPIEEFGATVGYLTAARQRNEISSFELEVLNAMGYFAGLCLTKLKEKDELLAELQFRPSMISVNSLVGQSSAIKQIREKVVKFASQRTPVLITGKTGVGKELVARALHAHAQWRNKPFVVFNCASVPETLAESELFGHEKGAFTDAIESRVGRFEAAHEGTLFLDEIGEMDISLQAKILRAIETGEIQRVGSSDVINVNTRVIAASNRDLTKEVQAGRFREDLFYRIHVLEINIPPLQERTEDIESLAQHFFEMFGPLICDALPVSKVTIDAMRSYPWPGNVRELRNLIERACVLCETRQDFDLMLRDYCFGRATIETEAGELTLTEKVASTEKLEILKTLRKCSGNKSETAKMLGITRQTLDRKIEQYELNDFIELLKRKGELS